MKQIFVDSRDRTSGTQSNFSITLPQTMTLGSGHQGRIDDFRLPVTTPTVYFGNSGVYLRIGSTNYQRYLPEQQYYTGEALANAMRTLLQSTNGKWDVYYDPGNTSLSIKCKNDKDEDQDFVFTGGSYMQRLLDRPYLTDGHSYYFNYVPLAGLDLCYLCCSNFSNLDSVGPKGASDCLCAIPITEPYGSVQAYSMSTSVFFDIPAITTQALSFQLRDRDYNILHVIPNVSFTLTID